ncbi:hypothetical protein BESB_077360 [Besnoitia besnoiti]|uniref:Phosphodiesterase n=1 Tax=Besnoitia besnoiti TaxID=94643 RepID=A0A2A9M6E4_BESBE|nr:hypothetical protein BESB_077360 [Besnoitia besnoiti]PFH33519.1 hypothetical protein BESB_077360 [Besnoitia besnoiti]
MQPALHVRRSWDDVSGFACDDSSPTSDQRDEAAAEGATGDSFACGTRLPHHSGYRTFSEVFSQAPWLQDPHYTDHVEALGSVQQRARSYPLLDESVRPTDALPAFVLGSTPRALYHGASGKQLETVGTATSFSAAEYSGRFRAGRGGSEDLEAVVAPDAAGGCGGDPLLRAESGRCRAEKKQGASGFAFLPSSLPSRQLVRLGTNASVTPAVEFRSAGARPDAPFGSCVFTEKNDLLSMFELGQGVCHISSCSREHSQSPSFVYDFENASTPFLTVPGKSGLEWSEKVEGHQAPREGKAVDFSDGDLHEEPAAGQRGGQEPAREFPELCLCAKAALPPTCPRPSPCDAIAAASHSALDKNPPFHPPNAVSRQALGHTGFDLTAGNTLVSLPRASASIPSIDNTTCCTELYASSRSSPASSKRTVKPLGLPGEPVVLEIRAKTYNDVPGISASAALQHDQSPYSAPSGVHDTASEAIEEGAPGTPSGLSCGASYRRAGSEGCCRPWLSSAKWLRGRFPRDCHWARCSLPFLIHPWRQVSREGRLGVCGKLESLPPLSAVDTQELDDGVTLFPSVPTIASCSTRTLGSGEADGASADYDSIEAELGRDVPNRSASGSFVFPAAAAAEDCCQPCADSAGRLGTFSTPTFLPLAAVHGNAEPGVSFSEGRSALAVRIGGAGPDSGGPVASNTGGAFAPARGKGSRSPLTAAASPGLQTHESTSRLPRFAEAAEEHSFPYRAPDSPEHRIAGPRALPASSAGEEAASARRDSADVVTGRVVKRDVGREERRSNFLVKRNAGSPHRLARDVKVNRLPLSDHTESVPERTSSTCLFTCPATSAASTPRSLSRMPGKEGQRAVPKLALPTARPATRREREARKLPPSQPERDASAKRFPGGPIRRYISHFLEMWGGDDWGSSYSDTQLEELGHQRDAARSNFDAVSQAHSRGQWEDTGSGKTDSAQGGDSGFPGRRVRASSVDDYFLQRKLASREAKIGEIELEAPHPSLEHSRGSVAALHHLGQEGEVDELDEEGELEEAKRDREDQHRTALLREQGGARRRITLVTERHRLASGSEMLGGDNASGGGDALPAAGHAHSRTRKGISRRERAHGRDIKTKAPPPRSQKWRVYDEDSRAAWRKGVTSPLLFEDKAEEEAYRLYLNRLFPFRLIVVGLVLILVEILQVSWRVVERSFVVDHHGQYDFYGLVKFDSLFTITSISLGVHVVVYGLLAAGGRIPGVKNRLESWSFAMIVLALSVRVCGMICVAFIGLGPVYAIGYSSPDSSNRGVPLVSEAQALSAELVLVSLCCLFHIIVVDMMLPVRTLLALPMHTIHIIGSIGCCILAICLHPRVITYNGPICAVSTCVFIVCGYLGRAQMEVAHRQLYARWKRSVERLRAAEEKLYSHDTSKTGIEQLAMLVRHSQVLLRHACFSGTSRLQKQVALEQVADIQAQVLDIVTNVNNVYHAQMNNEEMSELLRFVPEGQEETQRPVLGDWQGRSASFGGCGRLAPDPGAPAAGAGPLTAPPPKQKATAFAERQCPGAGGCAPWAALPEALSAFAAAAGNARLPPRLLDSSCGVKAEGGARMGKAFDRITRRPPELQAAHDGEVTSSTESAQEKLRHSRSEEDCTTESDASVAPLQEFVPDLPAHMRAAVGTDWQLDFFELNELVNNNALVVTGQVQLLPLLRSEGLRCSPHVLRCYLRCLQQQYHPNNPYHNQLHAAMVSHFCLLIVNEVLPSKQALNYADEVCLVLAAVAHDVGHPGLNNQYLISSQSLLATTYNDIAVLENYHAACCFRTAGIDEQHNIFRGLAKDVYRYMRQNIIALILSTDMSKHISYVSRLKVRSESGNFDLNTGGDRWLLFQTCLKAADLSHSATGWKQHKQWSEGLREEFFMQGDEERRQGMSVMEIFDRRQQGRFPQSQYRFIELVVEPLFHGIRSVEDLLKGRGGMRNTICKALEDNKRRWKEASEAAERAAGAGASKCHTPRKEDAVAELGRCAEARNAVGWGVGAVGVAIRAIADRGRDSVPCKHDNDQDRRAGADAAAGEEPEPRGSRREV